jgi:hypothetical protein
MDVGHLTTQSQRAHIERQAQQAALGAFVIAMNRERRRIRGRTWRSRLARLVAMRGTRRRLQQPRKTSIVGSR